MTVTTEDGGRQNMFAKEPQMYISKTDAERYGYETYAERAEKMNGRFAMMGIIAGFLSYAITGKFFLDLYDELLDNWTFYLYNNEHCLPCIVGILCRKFI